MDFDDNPYFKRFTVEKDKLIINRSGFNWLFIILGGLLSPPYIYTLYLYGLEMFTPPDPVLAWTIVLIVFNFGGGGLVYMFVQGFLGYKKVFVFDRARGTVTYPEIGWFCSKTIPFDDACFIFAQADRMNLNRRYLELMYSIGISGIGVSGYRYPRELYSLLVWYMDRNRPLPPGEKFDTFRQEDYERRSTEGFPKPLYPADIRVLDIDGKEPCYRNKPKGNIRINQTRKERKTKKN